MSRVDEDGGVLGDVIQPIERGMIKDWDAMEDLWRYVFYTHLGWEPGNEGQLLIAEPLLTPKVPLYLTPPPPSRIQIQILAFEKMLL